MLMNILAVAGGAFVGGCCRSLLADVANRKTWHIPWGTFLANMLGSLVLGICLGYLTVGTCTASVQALIMTGFCGGFTTFSTFTGEVATMITSSEPRKSRALTRAFAYWVGTVLAGLLAVLAGMMIGRAL